MKTTIERISDGKKFVILIEDNEAYVGTLESITNRDAQFICNEALENSEMHKSGHFKNFEINGTTVSCIGYTIPDSINDFIKTIEEIVNS